jgi:methyl-accepting chemotaxis protein
MARHHDSIGIAPELAASGAGFREQSSRSGDTLSRKTQPGFTAAAVMLAAAGLVSNISLHSYQQADGARDHARKVLGSVDQALQIAVDAESSTRGFVVTADEAFLEPGRGATRSAPEAVARLRLLVADSASQRQRVEELGPLIDQKVAWTSHVAEVRRTAGFETARQLVASSRGRQLMNDIRRVCREMTTEELGLLAQREAAVHRHGRAAQFVTVLGSALALLLVGGAILGFGRS